MGQATREIVGATAARWPRGTLQWAHRMRAFFTSDRVNSRRFIVTLWLLTRGAVIMLWLLFFFGTKGDVNYYFTQIYGEHKNTDNTIPRVGLACISSIAENTFVLLFRFPQGTCPYCFELFSGQ